MGLGRQTGAGGTGGRTWGCATVHRGTQGRSQGWGWGQTDGWGLCQHALGSIRQEQRKGLEGQTDSRTGRWGAPSQCLRVHRTGAEQEAGEQTDTGQKDGHGLRQGASGCMGKEHGRGLGYQTDSRTTGGEGGTALQCQWRAGHWAPTWGWTHRQTDGMGQGHVGRDREAPGAGRGLGGHRESRHQYRAPGHAAAPPSQTLHCGAETTPLPTG